MAGEVEKGGDRPLAPDAPGVSEPDRPRWRAANFSYSPSFPEVLRPLGCTLLVSTYQAGQLIAIGTDDHGVQFSLREFDQAMGVAVSPETIALGARGQIWSLKDNAQIAPLIEPRGRYDHCFLPRSSTVTGAIHCHELAWGRGDGGQPELWIVNTLFSCLANPHPEYSFAPRWRPPFISQLAGQDRCHLNGVGMRDGRPGFVTVMAQSDEPGGWREDKNRTGCVLDVTTGEPVSTGLAMPHSPRWHRGRLLVLNSGWGTLEAVDPESGERLEVASLPGFTRGLACHENLAFVGLSRIRETAVFGGVPIAARHQELKCGVAVIDLERGDTLARLEFESGIEEIFDVQLLPGARCAALAGSQPGEEIWVVPPGDGAPPEVGMSDAALSASLSRALDLQRAGRAADALAIFRQLATARPGSAEIANHLGNALQDVGDQEAALEAYRLAVAANPRYGPALQNLGYLLINQGLTEEGTRYLRQAQRVEPRDVNRVLIATASPIVHESAEALRERRKAIETEVHKLVATGVQIDTASTLVPTNFYLAYYGVDDRPLQEELGRIYRGPDLMAGGARGAGAGRAARPEGERLRVGFLSAYFRDHTIGRLNLGRIQRLGRERFEVVVLSAGLGGDPMAASFEQAADHFVRVPRDPAAARTLIADQRLDLLLFTDVGMDALTYTLAFSRMAPVQCATWGHPVTTGSSKIDYFISSELLEVPGAEQHYTETLIKLPSLGTYYPRVEPRDTAGVRERLGLEDRAHVYACPQTLFKLHPDFDPLIAQILRGDPAGVLVLIEGRVPAWTRLLQERLSRVMPDEQDRIRWLPPLPRHAFLELLACADVVLDPTSFGGGNTSYEALAMGTPVVTLPGQLLRNRITRALYAKAGYTEPIAHSPEEYVELALALGTDPDYRQAVSHKILETCPVLYEDEAEVRDLEAALVSAAERSLTAV